jgi:hypothetical protein
MTAKKPTVTALPAAGPDSPKPPKGLGERGLELWHRIVAGYEGFDEAPEKLILLEEAARTADLVARLQAAVDADDDLTTKGSMGQRVASPHLTELRQYRTQLASLLNRLVAGAGEDSDTGGTVLSRSDVGRLGAAARWKNR